MPITRRSDHRAKTMLHERNQGIGPEKISLPGKTQALGDA
jgi:hypothetical protein